MVDIPSGHDSTIVATRTLATSAGKALPKSLFVKPSHDDDYDDDDDDDDHDHDDHDDHDDDECRNKNTIVQKPQVFLLQTMILPHFSTKGKIKCDCGMQHI
ncbi:hypothetical protein WISP_121678 [Willisornis vidua]|uniref:Uncharacterized protein n=1 Tax=Willisornis vidua TaxID=1566151 RepID=A0ABQ9CXE5_9PASS|nr:hypothetical protein WISP_121678 [Willisornis vidua]